MALDRRRFATSLALAPLAAPGLGRAESTYPTHTIKIVCPFAPGGGSDFMARVAADSLGKRIGQAVLVENHPGAGGTLGTEIGLRAPADGYTLLLVAGSYTVNPSLYTLKFDPVKDMTPVIQLSKGAYVLCVNPKVRANTLQELFALCRKDPGGMTFASAGAGSHLHVVTQYMFDLAKVKATHVPYKGTGPAINDLLAGQVDMLFAGTEGLMPHVKAGKLRALAVGTRERLKAYPEIPSVAEQGLPEYDVVAWHGLVAPAGVPADIITRVNTELDTALKAKDMEARLDPTGVSPAGGPPEAFGNLIKAEIVRYAKVIKDGNIKAAD